MSNAVEQVWVAEYSLQQDAFHVDELGRSIRTNLQMVAGKRNNDYLVFGVFGTHEEASKACEVMKGIHGRGNKHDN